MSDQAKEAPLHRDAVALLGVMVDEFGPEAGDRLLQRLLEHTMALVDDVTLAVAGHGRLDRLEDADAGLRLVRTYLQLCCDLRLISEDDLLDFSEQADRVGRQIGGWLKKERGGGPARAGSRDRS